MTTKPPEPPRVAPRAKAEAELRDLLDEIPTWPDAMLVHMHKRFSTSRLFRIGHDPDAPLTGQAITLRDAAYTEMIDRGIEALADDTGG